MAHTELSLSERRTIEDMLHAKFSVDKIAAEIGRHRATVYREIKRNWYADHRAAKFEWLLWPDRAADRREPLRPAAQTCAVHRSAKSCD